VVSGTVGSLVAAVAIWLIPFSTAGLFWTLVAVTIVGVWSGSRVERLVGVKDPGVIVIDEVAGMMLSVLLVPRTIWTLLAGFVLFRIFDIVKPFPAHRSQSLGGGIGVMIDDLIAGLYALILLMIGVRLLG